MKHIVVVLLLFLFLVSYSNMYAIEPKTDDDETDLSPVEKQVKEIFEKTKNKDYDEEKLTEELVEVGEQAVPILLKELYNKDGKIIILSAYALNKISGDKALPEIIKAYCRHTLKIADPTKFNVYKIRWLIDAYGDKALPYLKKEIVTQDIDLRCEIVSTIANIETKKSIELMKELYKEEKSAQVKLKIIEHVYKDDKKNQKEYLDFVHKSLDDKEIKTVCMAIALSGQLKDKSNVKLFIKWTTHEDVLIRFAVFRSLCEICTEEAVDAIIGYLTNDDKKLRALAAENLKRVKANQYEKLNNEKLEKKVINALIKTLKDSDVEVRYFTIYSLSWFMDLEIIPHLKKIEENDPDETNRKNAKKAITDIKNNKKTHDELFGNDDDDDWGEEEKGWNSDE